MTVRIVTIAACYVPVALLAQIAPYGDVLREGGFVLVLVAMIRLVLRHLAMRDARAERAAQDFLGTQRALVQMAAERDQAIDAVGVQVAESFAECRDTIAANTAALRDSGRLHGQLHELLTACLRKKGTAENAEDAEKGRGTRH